MKMPAPMMPPTTSIVASKAPRALRKAISAAASGLRRPRRLDLQYLKASKLPGKVEVEGHARLAEDRAGMTAVPQVLPEHETLANDGRGRALDRAAGVAVAGKGRDARVGRADRPVTGVVLEDRRCERSPIVHVDDRRISVD